MFELQERPSNFGRVVCAPHVEMHTFLCVWHAHLPSGDRGLVHGFVQRALLTNGLRLVRPGGRVVYSTCR